MIRSMILRTLCAACVFAVAPAAAQVDYDARTSALTGLSQIFGELHHIRRMCEPGREADVWRERMKRLIDLEEPSFDLREAMVGSFNDGYVSAQARFSSCTRNAEDHAASRASSGQALVTALLMPLYAAERGADAEGINVTRGNEL